jgi:hypothetical protein
LKSPASNQNSTTYFLSFRYPQITIHDKLSSDGANRLDIWTRKLVIRAELRSARNLAQSGSAEYVIQNTIHKSNVKVQMEASSDQFILCLSMDRQLCQCHKQGLLTIRHWFPAHMIPYGATTKIPLFRARR